MSERYILVERTPTFEYEIWKSSEDRPDEFYELMATTQNRERARTLVKALNADEPIEWATRVVNADRPDEWVTDSFTENQSNHIVVEWDGDELEQELKSVHIFPNKEKTDEDPEIGPCGLVCHPHTDCSFACPRVVL